MQSGNLYGLIITVLSVAVTIVLAMQHVRQNGFRLELIIQPANEYVVPAEPVEQKPRSQSGETRKAKFAASLERSSI